MSDKENGIKSNSQSESSSSSPTPSLFFQEHFARDQKNEDSNDLTLFGSKAPTVTRSGTVKRVRSVTLRKELSLGYSSSTISEVNIASTRSEKVSSPSEQSNRSKFRRSLDSTFRHSLESISENNPKRSFSPSTLPLSNSSKYSSSLESMSSDQTDFAMRSETTEGKDGKTIPSPASSYLSWIESINSAYFSNNNSNLPHSNADEIDCKVGEWNNFWLDYSNSNARKRYLSSPYPSCDEKSSQVGESSEAKSSSTTQKEQNIRNPTEFVSMTLEELQETIKCSKRITEIMQNALSRNENDCENYVENSAYSETHSSRNDSSLKEDNVNVLSEDMMNVSREISSSYIINTQELIKQKESLKPSIQSSSTSCINALLNTGVADILKKVINKRRDVMTPDDVSSMTRRSYSEWSK